MKDKNIKAKLKDHLLQGKKITPLQAWRRWGTSRLAVYVRRLRIEGWNIETTIKRNNGDQFAEYSLVKTRKVNRIASGEYLRH